LIYNNVCAACHTSGVAGSPKLESAAWEPRLAQGMDTLVQHAIEGYQGDAGLMPARGGRMDLSDEQVRVTVQWMVDQLQ
ncbi:MAG: c-type cytochrome, partial [Pseudomonadota bacterium]